MTRPIDRIAALRARAGRLVRDEDGVALTEYLLVLGIIIAVVIASVLAFGEALGNAFEAWARWAGENSPRPPS